MEEKPIQESPKEAEDLLFTDSEKGGSDALRAILNVPLEEAGSSTKKKPMEVPPDPLGGATSERSGSSFDDLLGDDDDMQGIGEMFDDVDALAEFGVEILDLGMNYAAQAISGDWGQDDKYAIPETRKRKLRKPLAALLKKRSPKVSPELAFAIFVLGAYTPVLLLAYQERQRKRKAAEAEAAAVPKYVPRDTEEMDEKNEFEELIREARATAVPQPSAEAPMPRRPKRAGRPKGSTDKVQRKPRTLKGNE